MTEDDSSAGVIRRLEALDLEIRVLKATLRGATAAPIALPESLVVVVALVGTERVAIPLDCVVEVIPRVLLTRLPDTASHIAGYMQWRGHEAPVMDLARRWSGQPTAERMADRIIVVRLGGRLFGLLVAEIEAVETLDREVLQPVAPEAAGAAFALALWPRGTHSAIVVSVARLLDPLAETT